MALKTAKTTQQAETQVENEEKLTQEGAEATAEAAPEQDSQEQTSEPEAAAEPEEKDEPAPSKAVATSSESRAVSGSQFENSMAEQGFEGMTLGGLSFEQIRLPAEGQFLIGQDDEELGKEFDCVIQSTRARYVVRQSDDQDAEMYYSYDPAGKVNTEGVDMSATLEEWKDDGYEKPVIKKYIEAMAVMVNAEDRDGMMVMLSIPPASVQKFSGFVAQQQFMKNQVPNEFITRCIVGKKVKGNNGSNFFPWAFKNVGPAPELF